MQLHLIFVGKTNFPEVDVGIQRYLERIRHYFPVKLHVVKAQKITKKISEDSVRNLEGERILKLVDKQGFLIVWDQRGRQLGSVAFAKFLEQLNRSGDSNVWMVIGGPLGVSTELLDRAGAILSFSDMTFPHDLARLLVVEQLYRAFTIQRGEPYHK